MAISSNATGLRPGVCTSTTRPTTPYTGQIIYETDTGYLRVWDGSAWDYLSQKQDNTIGLGPTQGLVYITETSWSNVTNTIVDNCFTSDFANYRIQFDVTAVASDTPIYMQWRTGGSSGSTYNTADYDWQFLQAYSTVIATLSGLADSGGQLGYVYGNTGYLSQTVDIFNPQAALRPNVICASSSTAGTSHVLWRTSAVSNRVTTAFTGIRFYTYTNVNMTGKLRIYGYRNP